MSKYYLFLVIICSWSLSINNSLAADKNLTSTFRQLTQQDGLSNNSVGFRGDSILRDRQGFVWIATQAGLNRFDGYTIRQFQKSTQTDGPADDYIYSIFEDRDGFIWLAHHSGLDRFDPASEQFEQITANNNHNNTSYIGLNQDAEGDIWTTTTNVKIERYSADGEFKASYQPGENSPLFSFRRNISPAKNGDMWFPFTGGVLQYDASKSTFHTYRIKRKPSENPVSVNAVYYDENEQLWAGTGEGLYKLDSNKSQLLPLSDTKSSGSILKREIVDIFPGKNTGIWLLIRNEGLAYYSPTDGQANVVHHESQINDSSTQLFDLYIDDASFIWLGTNSGVSYAPLSRKDFQFRRNVVSAGESAEAKPVLTLLESHQGELWIGSFAGGLSRVRMDGTTQYFFQREDATSKSIFALHEDASDNLWVGTLRSGLLRFEPTTSSFVHYPGPKTITNIAEDSSGGLWMGTQKEGLAYLAADNSDITFVENHKIGKQGISSLLVDSHDNLWVGTPRGLYHIDRKLKEHKYFHADGNETPIIHNFVTALYEEEQAQRLWVGTTGGLSILDLKQSEVVNLTRDDGLPGDTISAIQKDANGRLWLGTNNGLSVISPGSLEIRNFSKADGLRETDFSQQAATTTQAGDILFGSSTGYTRFNPLELEESHIVPNLVLTNLRLFNIPVPIAASDTHENYSLAAAITYLTELRFSHKESFFSLEFSAVDAHNPGDVRYAYMLEGWDKNWINTDSTNRLASYTNIPSGEYVFKVRANNRSQSWQTEATPLAISISPPPWKSTTALLIYACLFVLVIFLIIKLRTLHLERRSRALEQTVNARVQEISQQKQTIEKLLRKKDEFFASVSHEFRTPLTLILGPLNRMSREDSTHQLENKLTPIIASGNRLLRMVDQLLDLSRSESLDNPDKKNIGVAEFVTEIQSLFESAFLEKQLTVKIDIQKRLCISISPDAFEKILANLLSNAIKYSPEGGELDITGTQRGQSVVLAFTDEGPGIAEQDYSRIFEHFVRLDNPETRQVPGAGIGLALVKQLCETYGGDISLRSQPGVGTTFYLNFPLTQEKTVTTEPELNSFASKQEVTNLHDMHAIEPGQSSTYKSDNLPMVLIVEDHPEMQRYLDTSLSREFNCLFADNGKQGLQTAIETIPDLIITDLMMPEVDGFTLAEALRDDEKTCHVPLIMLTARADIETRKYAWASDIDEFIEKPFDSEELTLRCHNLLNIRKILSRRVSNTVHRTDYQESSLLGERDKKFIDKLGSYLSLHYHDRELGAKVLCRALAMSESQLQRKIKALLGQTVPEYIRGYRLAQSSILLKNGKSVTEVAYSVGFSNPTYFSKCFKAEFGETPSSHQKSSMKEKA